MRGQETNTTQTRNTKQANKNHTTKPKTKQDTTQKTARSVISWSVHSHLKRIRRDDSIVSPLGLVDKMKQERTTNHEKCHTPISEPPRLPPARSLEITECKPRGQHSRNGAGAQRQLRFLSGVLCPCSARRRSQLHRGE